MMSYVSVGEGTPVAVWPNDIGGSDGTSGTLSIAGDVVHLPNTGTGSDSGGLYVVILVMVGLMAVAFLAAIIGVRCGK